MAFTTALLSETRLRSWTKRDASSAAANHSTPGQYLEILLRPALHNADKTLSIDDFGLESGPNEFGENGKTERRLKNVTSKRHWKE